MPEKNSKEPKTVNLREYSWFFIAFLLAPVCFVLLQVFKATAFYWVILPVFIAAVIYVLAFLTGLVFTE